MNILFAVAILVALFVYGSINYYVGLQVWQTLKCFIPILSSRVYWPLFWLIALSYLIARFAAKFLPDVIEYILTVIGAYWIGALVYFLLILILIKASGLVLRSLDKKLCFLPVWFKQGQASSVIGLLVILMVSGILIYGTLNARSPKVTHYDISIAKNANGITGLHAVAVSDVHLGTIIQRDRLKKMVDMINSLNPDIIFIAGDLIDGDISPFNKQSMADELKRLNPKYGVFFSPGNHERYEGHLEDIAKSLSEAGINVLMDRSLKVADSFYIIGREDIEANRRGNKARKKLNELTESIDKSLPVILLDHQPSKLEEPAAQGIDLQLSGHTHKGQMYPFNYITGKIFEKDWGYLKKDSFQLIVSSGFGTWGPPIRVGNRAELVDISIRFKD